MDDQLWARADGLLSAALELPADQRPAFVEKAAGGDAELEALVNRLLQHAEESAEELVPGLRLSAAPVQGLLAVEATNTAAPPGTVVGRYRLLDELGRGGMAVVYRAERIDGDFEQQVALKQILGPTSERLVRRLEQERQILARATHPDIARLLDGGADEGRPFLVMELVDGVPIDEYCDRERLSVRQRLGLFLRVAQAVQYAHRNLVVHRDLKPSNILVTADGNPKLLDFGIARLLTGQASEDAITLTHQGLRPMTPAYASPEQVRSEPVTTASDIYQLGLLLYLLLTGRTPYRQESARSPLDMARVISEEPPTHPHKAFLDPAAWEPGDDATTTVEKIARRRRTSSARLTRQLRGDLGSILLMALRKEPARRYASVGLMIEDVERHLAGRTVAARPDTLWYRVRTFSQRHRFAVLFAGLLFAALVVFSTISAMQARRVAAERDRANQEAAIAGQVSSFLTELFHVSDPSESRGNTITAREILDRGSAEIDVRMPEPSLVRARLKRTIGKVYENLGLYEEALPLYETSLATATEVGGAGNQEAVDARADLARLFLRLGRYEESEPLIHAALAARQAHFGAEHPKTLDLTGNLASLRLIQGHPEEAVALSRQALEVRRRVQGLDHPNTLAAATNLASTLFYLGRLDEAENLYQEIFAGLERSLGPDHPQTLKAASNLGSIWIQLKRFEEAEPLLRTTIEQRRRILGNDHPATLTAQNNLAGLLADRGERGDRNEAEELYRWVHERRRMTVGSDHPRTFDALYDLAWVISLDPTRRPQAIVLYREVLAGYEKTRGPEHPFVVDTLYALAVLEARGDRYEMALAHLQEAVARGYKSKALFDEPAFAPFADRPAMQALKKVVRSRLDSDDR